VYLQSSRREFARRIVRALLFLAGVSRLAYADDKESKSKTDDQKAGDPAPVYEPGGDVKAPKLIHYVEPSFSPSSKAAFVEGTVRILTVVTTEGKTASLHVIKGLNEEEDRTAIDAVRQWQFQPGTKSGHAVNVRVTVEVDFHLL
jgi:TonB family protein